MRTSKLNLNRKRRLILAASALVVALGVVSGFATLSAMPPPFGMGEGPWMNASTSYDCSEQEAGTICAEWPDADAGTTMVCCVDPGIVGTYESGGDTGCTVYLTERAID